MSMINDDACMKLAVGVEDGSVLTGLAVSTVPYEDLVKVSLRDYGGGTYTLGMEESGIIRLYKEMAEKDTLPDDEIIAVMQACFALLAKKEDIANNPGKRMLLMSLLAAFSGISSRWTREICFHEDCCDWAIVGDLKTIGVVSSVFDAFGIDMSEAERLKILTFSLAVFTSIASSDYSASGHFDATSASPTAFLACTKAMMADVMALVPEVLEIQSGTRSSKDCSDTLKLINISH